MLVSQLLSLPADVAVEISSFSGANLSKTSLRGAELNGAIITSDQLKQTRSTKDRL